MDPFFSGGFILGSDRLSPHFMSAFGTRILAGCAIY